MSPDATRWPGAARRLSRLNAEASCRTNIRSLPGELHVPHGVSCPRLGWARGFCVPPRSERDGWRCHLSVESTRCDRAGTLRVAEIKVSRPRSRAGCPDLAGWLAV